MSKLLRSLLLYQTGLLVPFKHSAPLTTSGISSACVYAHECIELIVLPSELFRDLEITFNKQINRWNNLWNLSQPLEIPVLS